MGGSSLPADLINDYLGGAATLIPVRDYELPDDVGFEDLVIASSYSGNTEETVACFEEALHKKIPVVVMSHDGELKQKALQASVPWIAIPECIRPRVATGFIFASLLGILQRMGRVKDQQAELEALSEFLKARQDFHDAQGKAIAEALKDRVPIIYGPTSLYGACRIWKIKFNENAKTQSFFNVFPELNHNEMVGYTHLAMKPALIFLQPPQMNPKILKRMEVMRDLLGDKLPVLILPLQGENLLQSMFDSLGVADYSSYYLAKNYGFDPAPVEMVENFKKRI